MNRNIVLCVVLLSALVTQAYADWETKWEHNGVAICDADSEQAWVDIISDGSGGAITTWWSRSTVTPYWDIYAQRVDSLGNCLWDSNGVLICDQTHEDEMLWINLICRRVEMCSDGAGGAIISWLDARNSAPGRPLENRNIYAQRVDSLGNCQWTANGVAICDQDSAQAEHRSCSDGAGGAIIAWRDFRTGYWYWHLVLCGGEIYAQRVDSSGTCLWTPNGIPICDTIETQHEPDLVSDNCGGAIITWEDARNGQHYRDSDVYAQRVDSLGNNLWARNGIVVCDAPHQQEYTDILPDTFSGGAIITWRDQRVEVSWYTGIYAQKLDSLGVPQWTPNGVKICERDSIRFEPLICSDGSGGAIIAWGDQRSGPQVDIYAGRVNSSGVSIWTADGIPICVAPYIQSSHHLAPDGCGGAVIAWQDGRGHWDIYAQRVDSSGVFEWPANGIVICDAYPTQYHPRVCYDGSGNIIAWQDNRRDFPQGFCYDIYAQRVGIAGPGVDETQTRGVSKTATLLPCFPNPFSDKVKISYSISKKMKLKLKIYDVAGHLVKTLVDRVEEPGSKIIEWHSRNDDGSIVPNGVYFCQLETDNFSQTRKLVLLK